MTAFKKQYINVLSKFYADKKAEVEFINLCQ